MEVIYNENYSCTSSLNYNENGLFDNYTISDKPQTLNYPSNYNSTWDF